MQCAKFSSRSTIAFTIMLCYYLLNIYAISVNLVQVTTDNSATKECKPIFDSCRLKHLMANWKRCTLKLEIKTLIRKLKVLIFVD